MNVYFFCCQDACVFVSLYMHGKKGSSSKHASVCVSVCVWCTAEGEGLTVGDKPDRPARCDYHPLDPLSYTHTLAVSHDAHTCMHNGQRGSVLQGFTIDRRRSLGSRARWKPQEKQMNTDWKIQCFLSCFTECSLFFFRFYVDIDVF